MVQTPLNFYFSTGTAAESGSFSPTHPAAKIAKPINDLCTAIPSLEKYILLHTFELAISFTENLYSEKQHRSKMPQFPYFSSILEGTEIWWSSGARCSHFLPRGSIIWSLILSHIVSLKLSRGKVEAGASYLLLWVWRNSWSGRFGVAFQNKITP